MFPAPSLLFPTAPHTGFGPRSGGAGARIGPEGLAPASAPSLGNVKTNRKTNAGLRHEMNTLSRMIQQQIEPISAIALPEDQMPELEVMLRLAFFLLSLENSADGCTITPDCQHVESGGRVIFPIIEFLAQERWDQIEKRGNESWEGVYAKDNQRLIIIATPSHADVFIRIGTRLVRAECKKGPLVKHKGSPERPIMHKLIGQLMMSKAIEPDELLLAAVPNTERF